MKTTRDSSNRLLASLALIVLGAACGIGNPIPTPVKGPDFSGVDFGPLVVRKPRAGEGYPAIADAVGSVQIGRHCVTLKSEPDGRNYLLVWWPGDVRWLSDRQEIAYFRAPDATPVIIRHGDRIVLPPDNLSSFRLAWVSPPHESCKGELHDTMGLWFE